jgi:hypothetical protein
MVFYIVKRAERNDNPQANYADDADQDANCHYIILQNKAAYCCNKSKPKALKSTTCVQSTNSI